MNRSNSKSNSWQRVRLGGLDFDISDGNYSSKYPTSSDFVNKGIPFVRADNFQNGKIVWNDMRFITVSKHQELKKGHLKKEDILITTRGEIGRLAFVSDEFIDANINAQIVRINTRNIIEPKFLFYSLLNKARYGFFQSIQTGTALQQLPVGVLKDIEIDFPKNIEDQKCIASILSAFDDKIELNNKISQTLEQMAQTIFKEWFVVPPKKDKLPKELRVVKLKDIADITMGQSPESKYYNEKGEGLPFHQGVTNFGDRFPIHKVFCTENTRIAEKEDILMSVRAPVGRLNIANTRISLGRGVGAIREKKKRQSFLYYLLKYKFYREDVMGGGSVFPAVTRSELEDMEITIPEEDIIDKFEQEVKPIDRKIELTSSENQKLSSLRDLLLPKLMSGEIMV